MHRSLAFEDIFNTAMWDKNRFILTRTALFSINYRDPLMKRFLLESTPNRKRERDQKGVSVLKKQDVLCGRIGLLCDYLEQYESRPSASIKK